jgi:hypothetical protein
MGTANTGTFAALYSTKILGTPDWIENYLHINVVFVEIAQRGFALTALIKIRFPSA